MPAFGVKQDAIPGFVRDSWFRAQKTGTFRGQCAELCGKEHAGYHVVTPLTLVDGRVVLVNRGWAPVGASRATLPTVAPPPGRVNVDGRIAIPSAEFFELAASPPAGSVWQNLDPERFTAATGVKVLPVMIEATQAPVPHDGLVREWPAPDFGVEKHRIYRMQWYLFAALAVVFWFVVQFRRRTPRPHAQARALARVHALRGGLLIVNDDATLAAEIGADGVHVGEDDASIVAAREIVGPDRLVGVSCYNDLERARAAVAAGADYIAFGSFFASTTKPHARRADAQLLARGRALGVPVVAIGGITAANAPLLIAAGASAVAVIADVFAHADACDVTRAARAFSLLFAKPRRGGAHEP